MTEKDSKLVINLTTFSFFLLWYIIIHNLPFHFIQFISWKFFTLLTETGNSYFCVTPKTYALQYFRKSALKSKSKGRILESLSGSFKILCQTASDIWSFRTRIHSDWQFLQKKVLTIWALFEVINLTWKWMKTILKIEWKPRKSYLKH